MEIFEHLFTHWKKAKGTDDCVTTENHFFFWVCSSDFQDFSVRATENNKLGATLMENLLINRDYLPFNKKKHYLPSQLFDN